MPAPRVTVVLLCPRGHSREHLFVDWDVVSWLRKNVAAGNARCDKCQQKVVRVEERIPS